MPRGFRLYLEDILAAINKIQNYIDDSTLDDFVKEDMKVDAVVRNLEIIGEASEIFQQKSKRNIRILNGERYLISEIY